MVAVRQRKAVDITQMMSDRTAEAQRLVLLQGLEIPERPVHERPRLTELDITTLEDELLTDLLVQFTGWRNYAAVLLTCAEIDENELREKVETAEAGAMLLGWGGGAGDRVTIAKAERTLDPEVLERKEKLGAAHAYRKMTQVIVESIDNDAFAVSREITRRGGGDGKTRRAARYDK